MGYQLIETVTLASSASSIEFTSIPQDGVDLVVKASLRVDDGNESGYISFNNTTGTNYPQKWLNGNGSSTQSSTRNDNGFFFSVWAISSYTANTFGNLEMYLSNYTSTNDISISVDNVTENNSTIAYQRIQAVTYTGGLAISSIKFVPQSSANFVTGSTASLYKIS